MVVREVNQKPNAYTSSVIIVLLAEPHGNNHHVLFEVMILQYQYYPGPG